jgi:DNA-binding response OmpR family regulator
LLHTPGGAITDLRRPFERESIDVVEGPFAGDLIYPCLRQHADLVVVEASVIWGAVDECARLRRDPTAGGTPVVLVADAMSETERIVALELGVSDCLVRPFSPREAVARIKVQLRRPWDVPVLRTGGLELDRERRQVRLGGRQIELTPSEFRILEALMSRAGVVLSERELLERGWGKDTGVSEGAIRVYVARLRAKLDDNPIRPRIIRSVRGYGYALEPGAAG